MREKNEGKEGRKTPVFLFFPRQEVPRNFCFEREDLANLAGFNFLRGKARKSRREKKKGKGWALI